MATVSSLGTPGRIRTCDLEIRSLLLYPAELRARICDVSRGGAECGLYPRQNEVVNGAADGTRTRNNQLGRLGLYQLNYGRNAGRAGRIRTGGPLLPKQVRYQAAPRPDDFRRVAGLTGTTRRRKPV
jgi:hypothetical protein